MNTLKEKIMTYIGLPMFIIGASSADSECLLIPVVLALTGAMLLYIGTRSYGEEDADD